MVGTRKKGVTGVRAVVRAVAVLRAFRVNQPRLSLSQVAANANIDKGTARRLLLTLKECGLVTQDPETQLYALTLAMIELGAPVADAVDLREAARPVLAKMARDIGCTAFLSVYQDRSALCLERLYDDRSIEFRWWPVGGSLPLNCGAAPKLLLAYQSRAEIMAAVSGSLVAMTPKSIVEPGKLRQRLDLIRHRGWEVAIDDVMLGLTAIAAPVLDRNQHLVAAVSCSVLTAQVQVGSNRQRFLGVVLDAARQLSDAL